MKAKSGIISIVLFLSIAGCAPEARATLVNSNFVIEDDIKYYIQTDKFIYNLGEEVEILYRVTNLTENPVDIGMVLNSTVLWSDFIITKDDGTDIWQYIRVIPPCGHIMFHLEPYESRELQIVWDMISDNATPFDHDDDYPVGPGLYNVMGELTLSGVDVYKRVPVSVSIEVVPEPATLLLLGLGGLMLRKRN